MLSVILWYLFLLSALLVLQRYTRFLTDLNIFTLFLGFLVLRSGITVPFDDSVNQWFAGIAVPQEALDRYHLGLYLMWAFLTAGVVLGRSVVGPARPAPVQGGRAPGPIPSGMNKGFIAFAVGSLVLLYLYQVRFDAAFWRLITGRLSSEEYRQMRTTLGLATNYSLGAMYHVSSIIRFGILPFLLYTLYFMRPRGWRWRALFWVALAMGLFLGVSSGQKMPAIFLLIGLGVAWYYRSGRTRIKLANLWIWLFVSVGLFGVFPFLYKLQYPEETYRWRLRATLYRITSEYDRTLQLYFHIYPRVHPFMHGTSSSILDSLFGVNMPESMLPERFIAIFYAGPTYVNTWNTVFIGVAWADFGFWGIIAESVAVGFILYCFLYWFGRAPRTAMTMGLQVTAVMAATKLSEVSLASSLMSFGLLSSVCAYLLVRGKEGKGPTA